MKTIRSVIQIFVKCFLVSVIVALPLHSNAAEKSTFTVMPELETDSTIHLGDPIVIDISLMNATDHRLVIMTGPAQRLDDPIERQSYRPGWYGLQLTDEQGKVVASAECANPKLMESNSPDLSSQFLNAGDHQMEYCPVSRLLNITRPGAYALTVGIYLPYANAPADSVDPITVIRSSHTVYTSTATLAITVLPPDSEHSSATADLLCRKIQGISYDKPHVTALADALFGMPASAAYESWKDLAEHHRGNLRSDQGTACVELARLGTDKAADLLADIVFNAPLIPGVAHQNTPGYLLQQMYNRGDQSLKRHIRTLYYYHGIANIPEQFPKFGTIN